MPNIWKIKNAPNHKPALTLTNIFPFLMSQTMIFSDDCCCVSSIFFRNPLCTPHLAISWAKNIIIIIIIVIIINNNNSTPFIKCLSLSNLSSLDVEIPLFSTQQIIVNSPGSSAPLLRCSRAAEVHPVLVDGKGLWGRAQSTRPWTPRISPKMGKIH